MAKINLQYHPAIARTYVADFPRLDGGLNIKELDYRIGKNESPDVLNMWWQDGILQCRDGQRFIRDPQLTNQKAHTCFPELFWDHAFFHIGDSIYYTDMTRLLNEDGSKPAMTKLCDGVGEVRGTFFRYNDWLFYKTKGVFKKIVYHATGTKFTVVDMVNDSPHVPTTVINASPVNGSGSMYQPENRLSPRKRITYNAMETQETVMATGDGSTKTFALGKKTSTFLTSVYQVYFGNGLVSNTQYTVDLANGNINFTVAPAAGTTITILIKIGVVVYKLPADNIDSVVSVKVNGVSKAVTTDYTVNKTLGTVTFKVPPPVTNPITNNTVEIVYSKANPDALNAIMDCRYATVFGGAQNVCIVLGGCDAQPNAYFWNGNDQYSMNAGYWPMSFYNFAGDTEDPITGFGKQYGELVVIKERSIGKSSFSIENVDDRNSISMTYTNINSKIGCDLPWSIQLIDNNLVFASTRGGVYIVRDSSSAYENNIMCISDKVNGTDRRKGLLDAVRSVDKDAVCSFDDDDRYWLVAGGKVYEWEYHISEWKAPSWFLFDNIPGIAFLKTIDTSFHLDEQGRLTQFIRTFSDYGGAIKKVYQFPTQFYDTYDRLKDVIYCLFAVRSDTDTDITILYSTDYEERLDRTDIRNYTWKLFPRNLEYRSLGVPRYAHVEKRKPGCRHIRHFTMRMENNQNGRDMALVYAQVFYRFTGKER